MYDELLDDIKTEGQKLFYNELVCMVCIELRVAFKHPGHKEGVKVKLYRGKPNIM